MGINRFGNQFVFSTFGESHGRGIGVVIDGCPSGVEISLNEIQEFVDRRKPKSAYSTPRREEDRVEILSGVFEGVSTGAPITIYIHNNDTDPSKYEATKNIYRLGHADYTYEKKYGVFDYLGGGRASARETVARVAAASIAKKIVCPMEAFAKVIEVGGEKTEEGINSVLKNAKEEGDSLGAIIECKVENVPSGLGEPLYGKVESMLASGMLSINACKGIEFGAGFASAKMYGSMHNDAMEIKKGTATFTSNNHGGILAGITTGMPIEFRVVFKPTSSVFREQKSVTKDGKNITYHLPEGSRHDVCVALRAPVIVESMAYLVLADLYLLNRCAKISELVH